MASSSGAPARTREKRQRSAVQRKLGSPFPLARRAVSMGHPLRPRRYRTAAAAAGCCLYGEEEEEGASSATQISRLPQTWWGEGRVGEVGRGGNGEPERARGGCGARRPLGRAERRVRGSNWGWGSCRGWRGVMTRRLCTWGFSGAGRKLGVEGGGLDRQLTRSPCSGAWSQSGSSQWLSAAFALALCQGRESYLWLECVCTVLAFRWEPAVRNWLPPVTRRPLVPLRRSSEV